MWEDMRKRKLPPSLYCLWAHPGKCQETLTVTVSMSSRSCIEHELIYEGEMWPQIVLYCLIHESAMSSTIQELFSDVIYTFDEGKRPNT